MFIRAIGLVKEVYDWFSFSQQAFSWLGLAQRAAAVTATAAVVAAPVVVATKPWQPTAPAPVTATTAPGAAASVPALTTEKISTDKAYSMVFLEQPENEAIREKLVQMCKTGTEVSPAQCEIAVAASKKVRQARFLAEHEERVRKLKEQQLQALDGPPPNIINK
jgi:hypothetical protein